MKLPGRTATWFGMAVYGAVVVGLAGYALAGLVGGGIGLAVGFVSTMAIGGLMCIQPEE